MKSISIFFIFILISSILWSGCAPRDPQVLSPDEKNDSFRKKNRNSDSDSNNSGNSNAKIQIPDDVDQKIYQYQIERKNQILEQVQWIENIRNNIFENGCMKIIKSKEKAPEQLPPSLVPTDLIVQEYRVQFENCQSLPPPVVNVRTAGSLNLNVLFNSKTNDWVQAEFSTNDLSPLTYIYTNRPLNQTLNITENQNLVLEKKSENNLIIVKSFESKMVGHGKLDNNDFDITVTNSGGVGVISVKNPEQFLIPNTLKNKEIFGDFEFRVFTKYESAPANSYSSLQVSQTLFIKKDNEKSFKALTKNGWQFCFLDSSNSTLKLEFGKKSKTPDFKSNQSEADCVNKLNTKGLEAVFGYNLFDQVPNLK